jgi:biopolymer transport protein ExbB|tara:strand:+ start:196 stop:639 length:444 start_codon:yes stop_codon:yes gene_type:complete
MLFINSLLPSELMTGGLVIWLIIGLALFCYGVLFEGMFKLVINRNPSWLKSWVSTLRTLISAMPLLGLLGTIIGLLDIFFALSQHAQTSMSDGIAKALFTTQMGMLMTIPAMVILWILTSKLEKMNADFSTQKEVKKEAQKEVKHAA